jgi:hypothetical protein
MERVVRLQANLTSKSPDLTFQIEIECGRTYTLHSLSLLKETAFKPRCIYKELP